MAKTNNTNQIGLSASAHAYTFKERGNVYNATTGTSATGGSYSSSPVGAYTYTPDAAANVPSIVQAKAGPK